MMRRHEFIIENNIDNDFINEFLDFYSNKTQPIDGITIHISINKSNISGEVDQLFLGYLSLYLIDFEHEDVIIHFRDIGREDRIFSLAQQIKNVVVTANIEVSRFKLYYQFTKKETGEIITPNVPFNLQVLELNANKSFIPTIFINKEKDILSNHYFDCSKESESLVKIRNIYEKKILEEIPLRIGKVNADEEFLSKLNINHLNFFELTLFRLLISEELYSLLGGKGITDKEKENRLNKHRGKILNYKIFVQNVSSGIKELAKNIEEHSSSEKGFITARIYDLDRIKELKGESENDYFNKRDEHIYISDKTGKKRYFLDINVGDLGVNSVKEKYISNLKDHDKQYKEKLVIQNIENDVEIIKGMDYKDFFVINPKVYFDLFHQQNKLISRFGLHHFTNVIKNASNGFIKVSSQFEGIAIYNNEDLEKIAVKANLIKYGTAYNCIVPIEINLPSSSNKELTKGKRFKEGQQIGAFKKLNKFKIISEESEFKLEESDRIIYKLDNDKIQLPSDLKSKYENLFELYNIIIGLPHRIRNSILLIDYENSGIENESNWLRLLSAINSIFRSIIVYNLPFEKTFDIIKIRKGYNKGNIHFWSKDSAILFYSIKKRKETFRYGATLLCGSSTNVFNNVNSLIWQHHYSFGGNDGIHYLFNEDKDQEECAEILKNPLFNNSILNYFEIIINIPDEFGGEVSLFEKSIQYSLNTPFKERLNTHTNNRGYKVEKTHFRLGSKIHISDFYYAKRMFQNSFFTTPLAYKIALDIKDLILDLESYTIVGYESYSSFFISTIRNLLCQLRSNININHCIIDKDGDISITPKSLRKNIFIVVPIASSFSTSIKIRNQLTGILERQDKKANVIDPYYNVVLVGHQEKNLITNELLPFQKLIHEGSSNDDYCDFNNLILNEFYWKSINTRKKIIKVNVFKTSTESAIKQKYYVPVYTKWEISSKCINCFPDLYPKERIIDEKCLIETGSASITPRLIFGLPKSKQTRHKTKKINLIDSLIYGNYKKGRNNYLYYTKTGRLVKNNKEAIIEWLEIIKKEIFQKINGKKTVIVTPSSGSKSNFLDLVNEILFEFTANCLVVSLEEDYIENAETLYSDGLYNADYVIYVDDVLSTVNSFLETNYIIKYIRNKKTYGKGIDFCISLINRMSYDCEENLLLKLIPLESEEFVENIKNVEKRLYYFSKMNTPSIDEPNNVFPLDKERERYNELSFTSSLDPIRDKFKNKEFKLRKKDLHNLSTGDINAKWERKKLFQLLILDKLYSVFEYQYDQYTVDLVQYFNIHEVKGFKYLSAFNNLKRFVKSSLDEDYSEEVISFIKPLYSNIDFTILKIICSTPLVYYKVIRETAFNWIILKLEKERIYIEEKLLNEDDSKLIKYFTDGEFPRIKSLKFFLKRSVELKSNFIINKVFFRTILKLIDKLYEFNCKPAIGSGLFAYKTNIPTKELVYSLSAYVQELLFNHETKALKLESTINDIIKVDNRDINGDLNNGNSNHYLRLLKLENTEAIDRFWFYYLDKEKNRNEKNPELAENEMSLLKIDELKISYANDPKYKSIIELEYNCQDALIEFFRLRAKLHNLSIPKAKTVIDEFETVGIEQNVSQILGGIAKIIQKEEGGDNDVIVNQCLLTVNFNSKTEFTNGDLFTFKLNKENAFTDSYVELENSATMEMFKGIKAYRQNRVSSNETIKLSNIEIRKDNEGKLLIRDNTLNPFFRDTEENDYLKSLEKFQSYSDIKKLNKNESLLLISISKYQEQQNLTPLLIQQAVLTIFLNNNERIVAEKLRLILLLRKSLSEYLSEHTTNNTFLELISQKNRNEYQKHLKHGIGNFISYQSSIVQNYEDIENKISIRGDEENTRLALDREYIRTGSQKFKEFLIINNSIASQIGITEKKYTNTKYLFYDLLIDMINTIYISENFHYRDIASLDYKESIKFTVESKFERIKLPLAVINSVIPEILFNQKKYGDNREINWNDNEGHLLFSFSNMKNDYAKNGIKGFGTKMCKEISDKFSFIEISIDEDEVMYTVLLRINKSYD